MTPVPSSCARVFTLIRICQCVHLDKKKKLWVRCAVVVLWAELERTALSRALEVLALNKLGTNWICAFSPLLKLNTCKQANCSLYNLNLAELTAEALSYLLHTGSHMGQCTISPINNYQDCVFMWCLLCIGAACDALRYMQLVTDQSAYVFVLFCLTAR